MEGPGTVIGASRQRRTTAARQLLDPPSDPLGLLLLVVGLEPIDELAAVILRPELLVRPSLVPGNDRVGGIEDDLGRAVVLFEFHDRRIGPVALEVEDVPDICAAPAVDRLVVVPDDREVVVTRGQGLDPQVLRPVRVLVFVDVQVAPALLVLLEGRWRFLEEPKRLQEEIVEVEGIRALERIPIFPRQPGDLDQCAGRDPHRGNLGRVDHVVLGAADRPENGLRTCLALGLHALLAQDLLHELVLVVRVVDQEPSIEANGLALASEQARAQGMERAGLDLLAGFSHQADDPLTELRRGPIGERHGQDSPRGDALDPDEIGHPVREHASLAGARAGEDQDGAIGRRHGPYLLRIEPCDDLPLARRGRLAPATFSFGIGRRCRIHGPSCSIGFRQPRGLGRGLDIEGLTEHGPGACVETCGAFLGRHGTAPGWSAGVGGAHAAIVGRHG